MSWLWGGKGSGDIVEVLGHFLRVAANRSEERLAILQQLKQFSQKQENHELLARAIGPLLKILKQSAGKEKDIEGVRTALEVLTNIMKLPEEDKLGLNYVEVINTDLFLKEGSETLPSSAGQPPRGSAGIMLVLTQFEETDFQVRYNAMQLLEIVSGNGHLTAIQETCLSTPTALSNIVELLKDSREVIRNESLLLLIDLCTNNVEIQKMAGVLGAMEAILSIVKKEGGADGGIIVADCLELLLILFRNNFVNQNNFRELSLMGRITPLLDLYGSQGVTGAISENKVRIVTLALKVVSTFVSANNPNAYTNQSLLAKEKVLPLISQIALARICPTTQLRSHALEATADLIRHHVENQNFIATLEIDIDGSKHAALLRLVHLALNSPFFSERWASANALSAFTAEHQEGQCALVSALTPPPVADERSIGQHLLGGLFGWESNPNDPSAAINCWFSSLIIQSILKDNAAAKEMALKLPINLPRQAPPSSSSSSASSLHPSLLSKCAESLMLAVKLNAHQYIKLAVARLICVWLNENANAVSSFLSFPQALSFLVEQVTAAASSTELHLQGMCALLLTVIFLGGDSGHFTAENSPITLIAQRVGLEKLAEKLDLTKKSEAFAYAEEPANVWSAERLNKDEEHPLFLKTLIFDYDFTLFLKEMHDKLQKQIRKGIQLSRPRQPQVKQPQPSSVSASISRDVNLPNLSTTAANGTVARQSHSSPSVVDDVVVGAYREQIAALKTRVAELEANAEKHRLERERSEQNPLENVSVLRKLLEEKDLEAATLRKEVDDRIAAEAQAKSEPAKDSLQLQTLTKAYVELEAVLHQRESELEQLKKTAAANAQPNAVDSLKERNRLLELDNSRLHTLVQTLQKEVAALKSAPPPASTSASSSSADTSVKLKQLEEKFANLEAEQEELLVHLAKTEIENNNLKEKLRLLQK